MTDEPNKLQSSEPQTLLSGFGAFNGLENIEPPKDVHARATTMIEELISLAFDAMNVLSDKFLDKCKQYGKCPSSVDFTSVYPHVQPALERLYFDETDISGFVSGLTTMDYPIHKSMILGVFTSCLAYTLTERNREKGKQTRIYVDGNGARFDYLFSCLPDFDEVIIEDFTGDYIGHSNSGIYFNDWSNIPHALKKVVNKKERGHKRLFGINLKGECIFGYVGGIDQVVLINVEGIYAGVNCGGYQEMFVDQVIAVNVKGNNALCGIGKEGSVNHVVAANVEGKEALENIASSYLVNKIIVDNIKGGEAFKGYNPGRNLNQMIFKNSMDLASDVKLFYKKGGTTIERLQGEYYFKGGCKELICFETATPEQREVIRRERINDILRLAHSLPGKPYQEVLAICDELYALRPEVQKGFFK